MLLNIWLVSERARRICTREYVEMKRKCALVKSILFYTGRVLYTDNINTSTEVPKEVTELMYTAQKDVVAEFGRRKLCPWCPLIVIVIVGAALVTLALAACPD